MNNESYLQHERALHEKKMIILAVWIICIWVVARECNRIALPLHISTWQSQSTSFLLKASFSLDMRRMVRPHQYHHLHRQQISNDSVHQSFSKRETKYMRSPSRTTKACKRCRGTCYHNAHRTTSNFCLTSDERTLILKAQGSLSHGQPTNEHRFDTCSRTLNHSSWCSRSMSTSFYCCSYLLLYFSAINL